MHHIKKRSWQIGIIVAIVLILIGVLFAARSLSENPAALHVLSEFGYFGVVVTAIIAGLNTFIPLPAATFTPLFMAAGLSFPLIIVALAVGTLIADYIGYTLGRVSREVFIEKHPKSFAFFSRLQEGNRWLLFLVVLLYAAFAPFPNELILIPLALSGLRFITIIVPLLIGNLMHQTIFSYGITSLFEAFFK